MTRHGLQPPHPAILASLETRDTYVRCRLDAEKRRWGARTPLKAMALPPATHMADPACATARSRSADSELHRNPKSP